MGALGVSPKVLAGGAAVAIAAFLFAFAASRLTADTPATPGPVAEEAGPSPAVTVLDVDAPAVAELPSGPALVALVAPPPPPPSSGGSRPSPPAPPPPPSIIDDNN